MSEDRISLEKRVENFQIVLQKHNITQIDPVRVALALDVSGSAEWMYQRSGRSHSIMQDTVDRLLAVANRFDDDGNMDMWTFASSVGAERQASASDYGSYIDQHLMHAQGDHYWGGTKYAPAMEAIIDFYFPSASTRAAAAQPKGFFSKIFGRSQSAADPAQEAQAGLPACCMLITDGANSDHSATEQILQATAGLPVYWHMVGVGNESEFHFIQRMADVFDHVGFVNLTTLDLSDDDLYNELMTTEFVDWVKQHSGS